MSLLILLGAVLGPFGSGVVSDRVLAALDPLAAAALAALGILIAEEAPLREAWRRTVSMRALNVALVLAGGVALALHREPSVPGALLLLVAVTGLTTMVATAAWLLLRPSASDIEHRIVVIASVALLAGTAESLLLSSLFCGYAAGILWRAVRGPAAELVLRDLTYVRQPVVAVILVVAGARLDVSPAIAAGAAGYAVAVAAASWFIGRTRQKPSPTGIPAGIVAVAVALTLTRVDQGTFAPLLGVLGGGWVAIDLASLSGRRPPREALA